MLLSPCTFQFESLDAVIGLYLRIQAFYKKMLWYKKDHFDKKTASISQINQTNWGFVRFTSLVCCSYKLVAKMLSNYISQKLVAL